MKFLGNGFKVGTGLAVGAGVILLAPIVIPMVSGVLKTLTKATIKGTLIAAEKTKMTIAEAKETIEDLAAEAKAELAEDVEAGTPAEEG
jgi:hypothetical protein